MVKNNFDYYDEYLKDLITSIRPGLSGIGSIVFRNEESLFDKSKNRERFYCTSIAPYKAQLENGTSTIIHYGYILILIAVTIFIIVKLNTKIVFRIFTKLPAIPDELKGGVL